MPISTPLKTPPSLRDTSSINRGGLKVLLFKFYLNSKRRCLFRRVIACINVNVGANRRVHPVMHCSLHRRLSRADTSAYPYDNSAHALAVSTVREISQHDFKDSSLCFEITATLQPTFISLQGQTHWPAPTDFTFPLSAFH